MNAIYCDGGVIRQNPSPIGGTWAVRFVKDGQIAAERSGVITAAGATVTDNMRSAILAGLFVVSEIPTISNNLTEMLAVLEGLSRLSANWTGAVYSDSQITLGRVFLGWKWSNLPDSFHRDYQAARARLVNWAQISHVLLAGHPSAAPRARSGRGIARGGGAGMSKTILTDVNGWTPLIDAITAELGMTTSAVFGRIWRYCQMDFHVCTASQQTIAEDLGLSRDTVNKACQTLVANGYLEEIERAGMTKTYSDTGKAGFRITIEADATGRNFRQVGKKEPTLSEIPTGYFRKVEPLWIVDLTEDGVTFGTENEPNRDWLEHRGKIEFTRILAGMTNRQISVKFVVSDPLPEAA